MQHRIVVTSELRAGDVVNEHGMRCLVDRPLEVSQVHPDSPGAGDGKTRWTLALVLNRDEVPGAVVPMGWTADWKRNARDEPLPHEGEHRWAIQGNDLARWAVEVEESPAEALERVKGRRAAARAAVTGQDG